MKFYVGAYGMSPAGQVFDEASEGAFIEGLKTLPFVRGLELPQYATLHRWDEDFFFRRADPDWDYLVTTLPAVSVALRETPAYGLAAVDDASREAALATVRAAHDSVRRTHDRLGRKAVKAVELHSAPSGGRLDGRSSVEAFAAALGEIGGWDWEDAALVVEHCDAAVAGQSYEKGFLSVEEEVAALRRANRRLDRPIGASLNWARSAIEGRSAAIVARHTALLQAAGLLRGMIFSGCSGHETAYGAWKDTHMPQAPAPYLEASEPESLLTDAEAHAFFAQVAAMPLHFVGLKIAVRPLDAPVQRRLALLRSGLEMLASSALAVH